MDNDEKNITLEFASSTTLHGVHHLIKERSKLYKIIWWVFIVTSISICTWQITTRVLDYLSYPITRESHENLNDYLIFPAVSLCMGHRVREPHMAEPLFSKYYNLIKDTWPIINRRHRASKEQLENLQNTSQEIKELYKQGFNYTNFIMDLGYLLNPDNVKKCRFADSYCSAEDFEFSITAYGVCWTFNGNLVSEKSVTQNRSGFENGLEIVLDLKVDSYEELLPPPTGTLQLYVHPRDDFLHALETGIILGPGMTTYVGLTYTKTKNLEQPYGPCIPGRQLKFYKTYNMVNCLLECKFGNIMEVCHCMRQIFVKNLSDPVVSRICPTHEIPLCFRKPEVRIFHENMLTNCPCTIGCEVESYDPRLSFIRNRYDDVTQYYAQKFNVSTENFTRNFVVLNVYYETLVSYSIEETRTSTMSSLISDIGGQLGLCLGMSMLTLLEILEYLIRSLWIKFVKQRKQIHSELTTNHNIVIHVAPSDELKNDFPNSIK